MSYENLVSGIFGAILGSLVQPIYSWIQEGRALNSIRRTYVAYLRQVVRYYLKIYINDCEAAIKIIDNHGSPSAEEDKHVFEMMPMLNLDFFKTEPPSIIRRLAKTNDDFVKIVELGYNIDFIKSTMPLFSINSYYEYVELHLREHEPSSDFTERASHVLNCSELKRKRKYYSSQLKLRVHTAKASIELSDSLLKSLENYTLVGYLLGAKCNLMLWTRQSPPTPNL